MILFLFHLAIRTHSLVIEDRSKLEIFSLQEMNNFSMGFYSEFKLKLLFFIKQIV